MKEATVVIPVHNDFEKLQKVLAQLIGDFEIIVIDTSDRPVYQNPPMGMVYLHGFRYVLNGFAKHLHVCPSMEKELGFEHATSSPVIFMTTDTVLKPGWLQRFKAVGVL